MMSSTHSHTGRGGPGLQFSATSATGWQVRPRPAVMSIIFAADRLSWAWELGSVRVTEAVC